MSHPSSPASTRLRWRVVVRTHGSLEAGRSARPLSWHMITCKDVESAESHCPVGRELLDTGDDPQGHCLLDGVCPVCARGGSTRG